MKKGILRHQLIANWRLQIAEWTFAGAKNNVYECPSANPTATCYWLGDKPLGYGTNAVLLPLPGSVATAVWIKRDRVSKPSDAALLADGIDYVRPGDYIGSLHPDYRHQNGANIAYVDGHAGRYRNPCPYSRGDTFWTGE